jgi:DNA-binding transcriptional LysR family regulator
MEQAFGTPLLIRGRAGVKPTPAGRTLLQHARGILAQTERLQEDLSPYARGLAGQVRVLSNTNALTEFLPETLSSFLMAHPDISVDLEERHPNEKPYGISGTKVREQLRGGERPDPRIMRPEIADLLIEAYRQT